MPRPADPTLRERILREAARLFYTRGVQGVGLADVIEAAGCGKNALYRHFPSKADLVAAYLDWFAEQRTGAMRTAAREAPDPAAALVALTREIAEQAAHERFNGCAVRNYVREAATLDDAPGNRATAILADWRADIGGLVARLDVDDPAALTDRVWLVHEGIYGSTAPERAGRAAVGLVEELVGGS